MEPFSTITFPSGGITILLISQAWVTVSALVLTAFSGSLNARCCAAEAWPFLDPDRVGAYSVSVEISAATSDMSVAR